MKLSDGIEQFILELLKEQSGTAEIGRNELAQSFGCVPSQINYVIRTRFNAERGYIVESRRGGGGYVKIARVKISPDNYFMHVINSIGNSIDCQTAYAIIRNTFENGLISEREKKLMLATVSNSSLPINKPACDNLRAIILKNIFASL